MLRGQSARVGFGLEGDRAVIELENIGLAQTATPQAAASGVKAGASLGQSQVTRQGDSYRQLAWPLANDQRLAIIKAPRIGEPPAATAASTTPAAAGSASGARGRAHESRPSYQIA